MIYNDTTRSIFIDTKDIKEYRSSDFNYSFDKHTGRTAIWGKNIDDDPEVAPFNMILDFEITERCSGIGNYGPCKFCFPSGTLIKTLDGDVRIEEIKENDKVISYNENNKVINTVLETYKRYYSGELITIETEDGTTLSMTDNHPVYVENIGWVKAKDLTEGMNIIKYE